MDTTNTILRSLLFSLSFVSFSIQLKPAEEAQSHSLKQPSPIHELIEVQRKASKELNSLFETKDMNPKKLSDDLQNDLQQLHEAAGTLKKQTGKLLKSHKHQRRSFLDSMFEEMEESQKTFGRFFSDIQKSFQTKSLSTNEYNIQETLGSNGKTYEVSLAMPDFDQEHVKVSIEESKKNGHSYNALKIAASKNNQNKSQTMTDDATVVTYSSHQSASNRSINGRLFSTNFKDGKLEASIDLPSTIQPNKYTMTFEKGILKIEFENDTADTRTKTLEFKKKETVQKEDDK